MTAAVLAPRSRPANRAPTTRVPPVPRRATRGRAIPTLALVSLALATLVSTLAAPGRARADEARAVYVGVYLRDVSRFEQREGIFDADFDLWLKWRGELEPEALAIANAAEVDRELLGEEVDGSWHSVRWRVRGTLRGEFPLHRFPFDRQTLPLIFELPEHHGRLVPDLASSSMAERFSVTDWLYRPTFRPATLERTLPSDLGHLRHESRPTVLHRVAFQVSLERPFAPVVLKLFVPLLIIVLVALASLFLHPGQTEARAGMGVTALLSCFAFQFTVADSLPAVTYVTLADTLFLIGYVVSGATIGITIVTSGLERVERERGALWVDRVARAVLPAGGLVAVVLAVPAEPPEVEPDAAPVPERSRPASAVDELTLGTNLFSSVSGSPLAFAAHRGLVHEDEDGRRTPIYVERLPGVDNDAMELLAGGQMRVTWTLREGVRWSDGEPLTSADLAFAQEVSPDPEVEAVDTPDERTFVVRWRHALARALEAPAAFAEHHYREAFDEGGYDAVRERWRAAPYPTLGPYRFAAHEPGESLVIEANPHYPGAPPAIARMRLRRYARDALGDAFAAGAIDMTVPNAVTPEGARTLAERGVEGVVFRPSALFTYLDLDFSVAPLAELEVRRALVAAIDRRRLARAIYEEAGRVAHVPVPGPLPEGLEPIAHDAEGARAVLEPRGIALTLFVDDSEVDRAIGARVSEDWREAGVEVEVREVQSTFRLARDGDHGGVVLTITRGSRDASPERYWNVPREGGRYDDAHRSPAYTDEVHALVEREERALYPERRAQLRERLFAAHGRRLPVLPLLFAAERILVRPDLRGWDTSPARPFGRGMETWWVDPDR